MVIRQIREYDPVSYVTAIGDITITFRFYWISSRGNPFGLPRCDIRLQQDDEWDEVTGLSVREWPNGFPEEPLLDIDEDIATFFAAMGIWGESGPLTHLELNYEAQLWAPLQLRVLIKASQIPPAPLTRDHRPLAVSLHKPNEETVYFWTGLRYNSLDRLSKIRLDLHLQIEWMNC